MMSAVSLKIEPRKIESGLNCEYIAGLQSLGQAAGWFVVKSSHIAGNYNPDAGML